MAKFRCPRCGAIFEGKTDRCPRCNVLFKFNEEDSNAPEYAYPERREEAPKQAVKEEQPAPLPEPIVEVREVVTLDERSIDEVIRDSKIDETYINGIGKNGDTLISLLDLNAVINEKENS